MTSTSPSARQPSETCATPGVEAIASACTNQPGATIAATASERRSNSTFESAPNMRIERKKPVSNCAVISRSIKAASPFCCDSDSARVAALSLFFRRSWVSSVSRADSTETVTLPAQASSTVHNISNQI